MTVAKLIGGRHEVNRLCLAAAFTVFVAGAATAGPVVREAAAGNASGIQPVVDLFRNDLGGTNNANAAGSQSGGRREINWDGGGAAANATTFPIPMTTFSNRGAVFVTPGSGFEISGQPMPEFGEINGTYPNLFAAFSTPRLFMPLNTNVMDVIFTVPGSTTVRAAVTGFGAVFTDVDSATSTKLEFYAPDGALLYERFVPNWDGNESFSFLGVSFNAGELVGRVRIIAGNAALGPDESATLDIVAMDDFIYGEPVSTTGLTLAPATGTLFRSGAFDIVVAASNLSANIASGQVLLNGADVTAQFLACVFASGGPSGSTFRCSPPRGFLAPGDHTLQVELRLSDQTRLRNAVRWTVMP